MKSANKIKVGIKYISEVLSSKLEENGYTANESRKISNEFIENEIIGKSEFGLGVFNKLLNFDSKKRKTPISKTTSGNVTIIDAGGRFAHCVVDSAVETLVDGARKKGIHAVGIKNNTTLIKCGYIVERLVNHDMIGICMMFVNGNFCSPAGRILPTFGTNPIAIGVPSKEKAFIYDSSTSQISWGGLCELKKRGIKKNGASNRDDQKRSNHKLCQKCRVHISFRR